MCNQWTVVQHAIQSLVNTLQQLPVWVWQSYVRQRRGVPPPSWSATAPLAAGSGFRSQRSSSTARAAAKRAIGTRNGEQET